MKLYARTRENVITAASFAKIAEEEPDPDDLDAWVADYVAEKDFAEGTQLLIATEDGAHLYEMKASVDAV